MKKLLLGLFFGLVALGVVGNGHGMSRVYYADTVNMLLVDQNQELEEHYEKRILEYVAEDSKSFKCVEWWVTKEFVTKLSRLFAYFKEYKSRETQENEYLGSLSFGLCMAIEPLQFLLDPQMPKELKDASRELLRGRFIACLSNLEAREEQEGVGSVDALFERCLGFFVDYTRAFLKEVENKHVFLPGKDGQGLLLQWDAQRKIFYLDEMAGQ